MMSFIVKFKMINGKEGRTLPFDNRLSAELAQIMMPITYVKSSEIKEINDEKT